MKSLEHKISIITGAGSGIGRSAAILFAENGSKVVCVGRRVELLRETVSMIEATGGEASFYSADLEDGEKATSVADFTISTYGAPDILVNNAGHSSTGRSILLVEPKEWSSVFAVNVEGVYRLTQAVLPHMLKNGAGTIITISSMAAQNPGLLGGAPYGAAKAAAHNLMQFINAELRNQGIRACTIFPAEVDTPILKKRPMPPSDEARSSMMKPEDIADAILLCATMPQRTMIEEMILSPTKTRDLSKDLEAARYAVAPA